MEDFFCSIREKSVFFGHAFEWKSVIFGYAFEWKSVIFWYVFEKKSVYHAIYVHTVRLPCSILLSHLPHPLSRRTAALCRLEREVVPTKEQLKEKMDSERFGSIDADFQDTRYMEKLR